MSDEDRGDANLKTLAVQQRPPAVKVALNLQVASSRDLVHVDRKGRVRSPARLRLLQYGSYGFLAATVGSATALYYTMIGPVGAGVGAALGVWAAYVLSHGFALRAGVRLLVADRFDEAAASFTGVAGRRLVPRRLRAAAEQNLGLCRTIGGRYEEALALYRSAIARWGRSQALLPSLARRGEICALVNLGRVPEARARLTALGPAPEGEYLKILHWTVELYLCLAEGKHVLAEDELYRRSRAALAITTAAGLLGLLAWAYEHLGDREMSQHLLRECLDRHHGPRLSGGLPLLQQWLDQAAPGAASAR